MREKDLVIGALLVRTEKEGAGKRESYLRVLAVADKDQRFEVIRKDAPKDEQALEGGLACVELHHDRGLRATDADLIRDVTFENFQDGVLPVLPEEKLGFLERPHLVVRYLALDSLAGVEPADEYGALEEYGLWLAETITSSMNRMLDNWDELRPLIVQASHPRIWRDALRYESWAECVADKWRDQITRWPFKELQTVIQELTAPPDGSEGMSGRMVAEIAGVSEFTVRQVKKYLESSGRLPKGRKTIGADGKARRPPSTSTGTSASQHADAGAEPVAQPPLRGDDLGNYLGTVAAGLITNARSMVTWREMTWEPLIANDFDAAIRAYWPGLTIADEDERAMLAVIIDLAGKDLGV